MGKILKPAGGKRSAVMSYTKHYYIGSERISAKTGTCVNTGYYPQGYLATKMPNLDANLVRTSSDDKVDKAENNINYVHEKLSLNPPALNSTDDYVEESSSFNHMLNELDYFYFHPDHLGSSSYITNAAGTVSQHMEYLPFGELLVDEHTNSYNSPFKYNGKEFDEETGNYNYGARYYDTKWSIFISVDPLAESYPDWSSYTYVYNNPIRWTDSTGMCPDGDCPDDKPKNKIAIDAGHGIRGSNNSAMDPGAVANGVKESDIALDISRSVNKYLTAFGEETTMIRDGELTVSGNSLVYRTDTAKENNANVFISIHIDAAANESASGFSVLYKGDNNKKLAESIIENQTVMGIRGRTGLVERTDLSVLNRFSQGAAVLIEVGFITNKNDVNLMTTKADNIGRDIAYGIYSYLTGGNPPPPPTLPEN